MILAKHYVCSPDLGAFNRGAASGVKRLGKDAYRKSICGVPGPWQGVDPCAGNRECSRCAKKIELLEQG